MNIELDEVVIMDVADEALELAAGGALGGLGSTVRGGSCTVSTGCGRSIGE